MSDNERDLVAGGNDASLLADAMSDNTGSETEAVETVETAAETPAGQPRDERGRFAPNAQQEAQDEYRDALEEPEQQETKDEPRIPSYRVKEEADKRRAAEERASRLEQQLFEALKLVQQPRQEPAKPQEPPPDFFEDPNAAFEHRIRSYLDPIKQQNEALRGQLFEMQAAAVHGQETIQAAYQDLQTLRASNPAAFQVEYGAIMNAPNPVLAACEWHKRQSVLREVGNDPKAYRERVLAEAMKDPEFRARVIAEERAAAAQPGAARNSITRLPPSLSRIPGASASEGTNRAMSDRDLLRDALRR